MVIQLAYSIASKFFVNYPCFVATKLEIFNSSLQKELVPKTDRSDIVLLNVADQLHILAYFERKSHTVSYYEGQSISIVTLVYLN